MDNENQNASEEVPEQLADTAPATDDHTSKNTIPWYKSLSFIGILMLTLIPAWDMLGVYTIMHTEGEELVLNESSRLIEQIGNNVISSLEERNREIQALALTVASASEKLPRQVPLFKKMLPHMFDFQKDLEIAGGGVWPDHYKFSKAVKKRSFFYGRESDGKFKYYDDYNKAARGYINDEWYPVVRYSRRGQCFWSKSYMDPYSFQPMVTCTVAMFEKNKFWGTTTIDLKLEGLHEEIQNWQEKTGGYLFLLDRNNKFLTFPKPELAKKYGKNDQGKKTEEFIYVNDLAEKKPLFKPIADAVVAMNEDIDSSAQDMKKYKKKLIKKINKDSDQIDKAEAKFITAVIADPLRQKLKDTYLYKKFEIENDFMNKDRSLVFMFHVPSSYWKLIAVKPFKEAALVATEISDTLVLMIAITVLIGVIIAAIPLHRLISKPLKETTVAVQKVGALISAGEFDKLNEHRLKEGDNELGQLSGVINALGSELQKSYGSLLELNANLESKVQQRTKDLQETLSEVRALKNQQDGDYFLTSLLWEPLGRNMSKSDTVFVDFYVQQYKRFEYKGKEGYLGGDLNVAGNLYFGDERYTMFINSDAMGKSMQGAGGAIVMGVAVNSIMDRSASGGKRITDKTPSEWLSDFFHEIQRLFLFFDGSMMVSAAAGIINEATGKVYYFNAEHPFSVLLRDGKAEYIENETMVHKFGSINDDKLAIQELQLQNNDVLIMGSDGRDDLNLATNGDGERNINSDAQLFLEAVEAGKGDLEATVASLSTKGQITDDLSLLSVGFSTVASPNRDTPAEDMSNKRRFIGQAVELIQHRDYEGARKILTQLLDKWPDDGRVRYYYGFTLFKLKEYQAAADSLEISATKKSVLVPSLKILGHINERLGNKELAVKYWNEYLELEGEDRQISDRVMALKS